MRMLRTGLAAWVGLLVVLLATAGRAAEPAAGTVAAPAKAAGKVAVVALHGEVDDYTRDGLFRQFRQAKAAGATTVVLDLHTPGGLVTAALDVTQFLRSQHELHTVAFVRRAYSAGAMIAVACDEIVVAPGGVLGDCAPIIVDNDHNLVPMPAAERAKMQSPILSDFDASADRNHYPRVLLEAMVVAERSVYWMQDPKTGQRQFVDEVGWGQKLRAGWTDVPGTHNPVDGPETLLTVQAEEAVKLGLASGMAGSPADLAGRRGMAVVADLSPGAGEKVVELLNGTAVRGVLVAVLLSSLAVALGAPGHGAAEAVAVVSLGTLVGVPLLTGYAQWWEVGIILAGLALLAFEVFVFPGHGVSAAAGIVMVLGGLVMTFVGGDAIGGGVLPHSAGAWHDLEHGLSAVGGGVGGAVVLAVLGRKQLGKLPYFNRLVLSTVSGGAAAPDHVPFENAWPGVGTRGRAATDLRPGGSAEFLDLSGGARGVNVVSDAGYVVAGTTVVVREARGNRVVVTPASA